MSATPGPWRITGQSVQAVSHGQWFKVATVNGPRLTPAGNEANAVLIAMAPEMLEALQRAAPWLGKLIADGGHNAAVLPADAVRTLEMVEKAIKRAEGGTA